MAEQKSDRFTVDHTDQSETQLTYDPATPEEVAAALDYATGAGIAFRALNAAAIAALQEAPAVASATVNFTGTEQ
ncbi:MAG TPA: hypothetical protein VLI90_19155 [Tepidisphaeraceae bacterium]|nr:hypothetical protein [Tepidisphaeraceae bacterium]